jgi:hypothetical protein
MDGGELENSEEELKKVAHRAYTQAYADGKNAQTVNYLDSQSKGEYVYIADVLEGGDGIAKVQMRNRFKQGERLEVLTPSNHFKKSFIVEEIIDSKGERTDDGKLVGEIYQINCPYVLQKGDFLRRKTGEK